MKIINIKNQPLTENSIFTYLGASASSGGSTITVDSIVGFGINKVLLIGEWGNEKSEVIKTHTATAPTGTTVTLASNLVFDHNVKTKIYIIDYDQLEISHADSESGSKDILSTFALQADRLETQYTDTIETAGYYFGRWKNTITTTYSDYSASIPFGGYTTEQVGYLINYALRRNKTEFNDNVTYDFCIDEINACLNYIHGKRKKWHRLQQFDYILGQTAQGENSFSLPSDMWQYSNKSVLAVHVEGEDNMRYLDEREWNEQMEGVINTDIPAGATAGDTSIALTNSYGFPEAGNIMIEGQVIAYTSNTEATGTLAGIATSGTGSITANITAGAQVWYGDFEKGVPNSYTIKEGSLFYWPIPDSSDDDYNMMLDYWKEAPLIDSDNDTIDMFRYDMVKHWLVWVIRAQKNNDGLRDQADGDYILFERFLHDAIKIEANSTGQKYKMNPLVNKIRFK